MTRACFIVSGKVQGVFFRASARNEALRLGVDGYARNLADGCVEVIASGSDEALHELERWLRHGPPAARVDEVIRSTYQGEVRSRGFAVL
ncbi:acylphosphatase [Dyella monticola]|uniref:Acylphosphatase n=1 Tax=Dyella monticola TaxID=1927958 RepID=A0A370X4H5_9GAMM|nr:acylphosphatase [Dyella monticola]RDS83115.1 acylphosphatase [Dyella monticola]